jgi:hypothetical protein
VVDLAEHGEDLSGHVALEAAKDLFVGLALGGAPGGVVAGGLMPAQPYDHDAVQRGVGLAVAAAVEAVPAGLAGGGLHRRGAAQRGERGLGVQASGVVAGGDQQRGGAVGPDAVQAAQRRDVAGGEGVELLGEQGDLGVEVLVAAGQAAQGQPGRRGRGGKRARLERGGGADQPGGGQPRELLAALGWGGD